MLETFLAIAARVPLAVLLGLSAASTLAGDYLAKSWSVTRSSRTFWLALVAYGLCGFFYTPTLLRSTLVTTSLVWSLLTILGFLFIGFIVFHEVLTPWQVAGAALGILALAILYATLAA